MRAQNEREVERTEVQDHWGLEGGRSLDDVDV